MFIPVFVLVAGAMFSACSQTPEYRSNSIRNQARNAQQERVSTIDSDRAPYRSHRIAAEPSTRETFDVQSDSSTEDSESGAETTEVQEDPSYLEAGQEPYPLDWEQEQYRFHARVGGRYTDWAGDRDDWNRQEALLGYDRPGGGIYNIQARRLDRFDETEEQIGFDAYPPLWGRAYANASYLWSPDPETIPRNDAQLTVYQPITSDWKIYPGYRHANFKGGNDVNVYSMGVGHYVGSWFLRSKLQYSNEGGDDGFMMDLNARYYFNRDHRIELGTSFGEETVGYYAGDTTEHRDTQIYRARYDYFFSDQVGFDAEVRYRDMEDLPVGRMIMLGLKIRWDAYGGSDN